MAIRRTRQTKAAQSQGNPAAFNSFRRISKTKTTTVIEHGDGSKVAIEQTRHTETLIEKTGPSPKKRKLSDAADGDGDLEGDKDESGNYDVPLSKRKRSSHTLMEYDSIVRTRSSKKADGEIHVQLGSNPAADDASFTAAPEEKQAKDAAKTTSAEMDTPKKPNGRRYDTAENRRLNRIRAARTVKLFLPRHQSNVVKLPITYQLVQTAKQKLMSQWFRAIPTTGNPSNDKYGRGGFTAPEHHDNLEYKLKLKMTPFPGKLEPTPEEAAEVIQRLQPWHRENFGINLDDRGRDLEADTAATVGASVDSLVRVLMAQATTNDLALVLQDVLRQAFTYDVNGEEVVGNMPNYHAMRVCSQERLGKIIGGAGFGVNRALSIIYMLDYVYQVNEALIRAANNGDLPVDMELGQEPNLATFVPGMLSLDRLNTASEDTAWAYLLNMDGMGVKSAACVQSFHLAALVIAVDTHIRKMCLMLGWAPHDKVSALDLFKHISGRIPNEHKHLLHQLFWYHPQQCKRCKHRRTDAVSETASGKDVCPLEDLVDRRRITDDTIVEAPKEAATPKQLRTAKTTKTPRKSKTESKRVPLKKEEAKKVSKKVSKKVLTWCFEAKVTEEEAAELGLIRLEAPIDGDFGTGRITGYLVYYMKPKFWENVTVEEAENAMVKGEGEGEGEAAE